MIRTVAFCCLSSTFVLAQNTPHVPPYPRIDATIGYKADPSWPKEKAPGADWGAMSSVAIGPDGNIWTFNRGKIPVQVFSPERQTGEVLGPGRRSLQESAYDSFR